MFLKATTHALSRLEAHLMSSASQLLNKIDSAAWPVARPKQSVKLCLASASPCIQFDINKFRTHDRTNERSHHIQFCPLYGILAIKYNYFYSAQ